MVVLTGIYKLETRDAAGRSVDAGGHRPADLGGARGAEHRVGGEPEHAVAPREVNGEWTLRVS
jgi:hypothetical protein